MENCTNTGAKVFVLLRANCCTNCYYNFNPCGIFENIYDVIYPNFQPRIGTRKIEHFTVVCLVTWPLYGSEAAGPCFDTDLTVFVV